MRPHNVTEEAWKSTEKLREYYTRLNNIIGLHLHEKHGWGGHCDCENMRDAHQALAITYADIKRALWPPENNGPFELKRLEHEIMAYLRAEPNPLIDKSLVTETLVPSLAEPKE